MCFILFFAYLCAQLLFLSNCLVVCIDISSVFLLVLYWFVLTASVFYPIFVSFV
jgi:hypothetical protein